MLKLQASTQIHKRIFLLCLVCICLMMLIACDNTNNGEPPIVKKTYSVDSFTTWADKSKLLKKEEASNTTIDLDSEYTKINIDPSIKYQVIDGFGAAMTESSASAITNLDENDKHNVLDELFNKEGLNMSFMRLTIGASDFSLDNYTYNDTPSNIEDLALNNFSIDREMQHLIPVLKEALIRNNDLFIMASPWSAPAWMKDNKHLNGGSLLDKYIDVYAQYFVKYIEAMKLQGIDIYAVTPQNEPLHESNTYPTMKMLPDQQINLIESMGIQFNEANIDTLIMAYDHNWDRMDYPITVLNSKANQYIAGVALHGYGGNVSETSRLGNIFPDKGIWFTEISGGLWATNFGDNISWNMENNFMGSLNRGAKGVLMWNIALNENNGPVNGGCQNCRGILTIHSETSEVIKNEEYYMIGHFSKFVEVGAYRIDSKTSNANLLNTAFLNPDGSITVVVHNKSSNSMMFSLDINGSQMNYKLPAKATTTFVLNENIINEN